MGMLKTRGKIDKYQDLRIELQKIWNAIVVVILVVMSALGAMTKGIHQYIKQIDILVDMISIQKPATL